MAQSVPGVDAEFFFKFDVAGVIFSGQLHSVALFSQVDGNASTVPSWSKLTTTNSFPDMQKITSKPREIFQRPQARLQKNEKSANGGETSVLRNAILTQKYCKYHVEFTLGL